MTDRAYCPTCRDTVTMDYPHSCYDASKVIALHDAERRVVEAAEAWLYKGASKFDIAEAVRALRAVRGGNHP